MFNRLALKVDFFDALGVDVGLEFFDHSFDHDHQP